MYDIYDNKLFDFGETISIRKQGCASRDKNNTIWESGDKSKALTKTAIGVDGGKECMLLCVYNFIVFFL